MRPYFVLVLLWVSQLGMAQNNCSSRRYIDRVFNNVTVQRDIKYGRATTWTGADKDMLLDMFSPANDTIPYRPVIIWAHSGAFIDAINDKGVPDMQAFADSFAHKGYVTMSIDYRCGYIGLQTQVERAVYRALQDGKAVVRFLKANYQVYGIDTNNIFFAGSSAGAITALLTAYVDKQSERPSSSYYQFGIGPDLGCLDCSTNSYTNSSKIKAVVSLWGGLNDTNYIEHPTDPDALLIHGTQDQIVPYDYAQPFANVGFWFPYIYGSLNLDRRMNHVGVKHEFYPFVLPAGTINHEFYGVSNGYWLNGTGPNQYWDTVHHLIRNFLYKEVKPVIDTIYGDRDVCAYPWQTHTYYPNLHPGSRYCATVTGGHIVASYADSISVAWDSAGTGTITFTELNYLDAQGDAFSINVNIKPLPPLALTPGGSICPGDTLSLAAAGNGSILWQPIDGLTSDTAARVDASPSNTTQYQVTLTGTNGCISNDSTTVEVKPLPTLTAPTAASICVGDTATLQANGTGQFTWWPAQTLDTDTGAAVRAYPTQNTTYRLQLAGSNGCSVNDSVAVTVMPLPLLIAPSATSICLGDTATLQASGNGTIDWSPSPTLDVDTGQTVMASPTSTTTYLLSLTDTNGCMAHDSATITVNMPPVALFGFTVNGFDVLFTDSSGTGNTLNWDYGDGNSSSLTNPHHTFDTAGTYTVQLLATNADGCQATTTAQVTVPQYNTGIDNTDNDFGFVLYPNPAKDVVYLHYNGVKLNAILILFDEQGKEIKNYQNITLNNITPLKISGLAAGIYTLNVITDSKLSHIRFVIL